MRSLSFPTSLCSPPFFTPTSETWHQRCVFHLSRREQSHRRLLGAYPSTAFIRITVSTIDINLKIWNHYKSKKVFSYNQEDLHRSGIDQLFFLMLPLPIGILYVCRPPVMII